MEKVDLTKVRRLDTYFMSCFNKEEQDILDLSNLLLENIPNVYLMEIRYDDIPVGVMEVIGNRDILDMKIVILPFYRYQGIGKLAILETVDTLGSSLSHIKRFTMNINKDNKRAIALAKSCGFCYDKKLYSKDNEFYDKYSLGKSEVAFSSIEDTPCKIKVDINNRVYDIHIKNTYDGVSLIGNISLPIDELSYYLGYIIKCMGPVYTDSMYFSYSLQIPYKANLDNIINCFVSRGFIFDTLESSREVLVFKKENPYYQERINDILRKRLYVHHNR